MIDTSVVPSGSTLETREIGILNSDNKKAVITEYFYYDDNGSWILLGYTTNLYVDEEITSSVDTETQNEAISISKNHTGLN